MNLSRLVTAGLVLPLFLAACSSDQLGMIRSTTPTVAAYAAPVPASRTLPAGPRTERELDGLIAKYSAMHGVPESLVHRVVRRESNYNPRARNGPNLGLMQIQHATARTMGYRGEATGLLDAETNLNYAVKYLRGAYIVGDRNEDQAVRLYSRGYYYDAKRKGLLDEAGLR
ncbi:lytic transglycosylase domain-containing protein [Arsenicitalea aurantiaca]|uniref:Lytic transglycosylase domain-containing protein n=1 Tax=Arsenicitalea aurantiaca TaxID=1783274 RepID=A0A433X885_9HYPH|nr:lytic transglycosylase domain-containing protein [Arsenicitalea aurantiaca]